MENETNLSGVHASSGVSLSNGVYDSNGVYLSTGVNRSRAVRLSNGVYASSDVSHTKGVSISAGVHASSGVSISTGVSRSHGVNDSYGVLKCFGVSNAMFCVRLQSRPRLFNKEVSEERFKSVSNRLEELLEGWHPTFSNLHSLWLKNGRDWAKTPIKDAREISKKEAWATMPKAALEFLRGLEEFDPEIFYEITGIE